VKRLALLLLLPLASTAAEYRCGLYDVSVEPVRQITLNGVTGRYTETMVDKYYNFHHLFDYDGKTAVIRETTHGRIAFRIDGETLWNACKEVDNRG